MSEDDAGEDAVRSGVDASTDGGRPGEGDGTMDTDGSDGVDELSRSDTVGLGWLAVGVLVVAAVALLLVGLATDAPLAASATELGIGFAWLLAATYVGFRVPGSPRRRLVGASAFVVAATAQFVSLVVSHVALEAASLVGIVVGAISLLVLVVRGPESADAESADDGLADDGLADDGSADDGLADDGSADDGSAGDGSVDAASAEAESQDGESVDAESADDG